MKITKIIPLCLVLMLGACGTNTQSSSTSQPVDPSSQETSSELDLFGFDLKKEEAISVEATYNLADQINLHSGVSISDLSFVVGERTEPIATINEAGLLTRVAYGSTQVRIARKAAPLMDKLFTIHFFPSVDAMVGRFSAELTPATGHEDAKVRVTIETKSDNTFTISYTAGWVSVGSEEPESIQIQNAIEAQGSYELESILKFTVTSANFPFKKTFGARLAFDGANPVIDTRVPVAESKTSNRTKFVKAVA